MKLTSTWTCEPYQVAAAARLTDLLGLSPAAAAILTRRGYGDPAAACAFLRADERSDPSDLFGVGNACEVILRHVGAGTRVAVFGDYDVDGVCSTAMMIRTLRALGADPLWRLPSRDEGYGLSTAAVQELAGAGAKLLVTVDCGVGSLEEIAVARECGMDVVVTDHHRPSATLPDCPVVHPGLGEGPNPELCAAGVVLKLSQALRERAGLDPREAEEDIELAGLATVCDMVPLRGENRRIARQGIEALARTRRPGLRALMRVAGVEPGDVDARAAGFRLGPRINAAGRLQRADAALELLLTDDPERADQVARELDLLNRDRQETEQRILSAAEAACADQLHAAAIVVAGEGWHPGVVGIVASRLVERHGRPCVVIALDGATGRGSGRSIAAYDLHDGIASGQSHLLSFGGHRMAAGLQVAADRVADFRAALATHAGERLSPADLIHVQRVDAVLGGDGLSLDLAEELERLGPFGAGNPAPALLVPGAGIEHVTAMGEERAHARFSLVAGGARARGVAFRTSQRSLAACGAAPHDVAVGLERNCWNGRVEPRVVMCSLSPTRAGRLLDVGTRPFWDELECELAADPAQCWPVSSQAGTQTRTVRDRRREGFAGVAGDLLTSGEPVLVVMADVERRRGSLEAVVAGMAPGGLAAISWAALGADTAPAGAYAHLLALDPPPTEEGVALLGEAPGAGLSHLAWGEQECSFTAAYWRAQLAVRPVLTELWRSLNGGSLAGDALEAVLRGSGAYPRSGALGGRLLRVLSELALVEVDAARRSCRALPGARTNLERSGAHRAYGARLAAAERFLAGAAGAGTPVSEAQVG